MNEPLQMLEYARQTRIDRAIHIRLGAA